MIDEETLVYAILTGDTVLENALRSVLYYRPNKNPNSNFELFNTTVKNQLIANVQQMLKQRGL